MHKRSGTKTRRLREQQPRRLLHPGSILLGESAEFPANKAVVKRKELEANDGRRRESGTPRSVIGTSSGHGAWLADVIMAITLWPAERLNAARSETMSAGRIDWACRSVKGNGTRTTSKRSKLAICHFVLGRMPFAQSVLNC